MINLNKYVDFNNNVHHIDTKDVVINAHMYVTAINFAYIYLHIIKVIKICRSCEHIQKSDYLKTKISIH